MREGLAGPAVSDPRVGGQMPSVFLADTAASSGFGTCASVVLALKPNAFHWESSHKTEHRVSVDMHCFHS